MPVIFISRGTMSGVHFLVDCLHERTGIRCISREDLTKIVNQQGALATRVLEKLAKATSAYDQFSELRWPYMVLMREALLEEIRADNVIYHGYSGHLMLPILRHFVRVRIEAPLDLRIKMTMQRLDCDEAMAREYIIDADDHRVKWARFMYGADIRNTLLYDIHLNQERFSMAGACKFLEGILAAEDFQASAESQKEVEQMYLAVRVEVALVTNPRTQAYEISAAAQNGGILLTGPYLEDSELDTIKAIALGVDGVEKVTYRPGYTSKMEVNEIY
ncbi:MAG: cytidylate kinase family protein [Desulfosarcinaceae bacterium]